MKGGLTIKLGNNVQFIPARPNREIIPVGIYCRVSTADAAQLESLSAQISGLTNYVSNFDDWKLVDAYVEVSSAKTGSNRTQFNRLIQDCQKGKIKLIVAKSIERMGRDTVDVLIGIRAIKESGTRLLLVDSLIDTQYMDDEMLTSIVASLAQAGNESRSQNIKMGYKNHAANGTSKLYQRKCFGYKNDENGELVIDETEAEVVRNIFKLYLTGYSIGGIIKELEGKDILTPTGKERWYKGTVDSILSNEKYVGDVELFKPDETTETYLASDCHPAIIERSTFQAVKLEKQSRSNVENTADGPKRKSKKFSSKRK